MEKFEYLGKLPAELRDGIFSHCDLEWNSDGMPALLVALRVQQYWYQYALELFYERSTFYLHTWNKYSIKRMSRHAITTIRKIDLSIDTHDKTWENFDLERWPIKGKVDYLEIREISLSFNGYPSKPRNNLDHDRANTFLQHFERFLDVFKALQEVSVAVPRIISSTDLQRAIKRRQKYLAAKIEWIANVVGTKGVLVKQPKSVCDMIVWEAKEWRLMDWSRLAGRKDGPCMESF